MKTVKIQETGRHAHPGQDRRFAGGVAHPRPQRAPARSGVAIQFYLVLASGPLSTGSLAGRTLTKKGDGSMYSQPYVSFKVKVLRAPCSSVAVRDRGHRRKS